MTTQTFNTDIIKHDAQRAIIMLNEAQQGNDNARALMLCVVSQSFAMQLHNDSLQDLPFFNSLEKGMKSALKRDILLQFFNIDNPTSAEKKAIQDILQPIVYLALKGYTAQMIDGLLHVPSELVSETTNPEGIMTIARSISDVIKNAKRIFKGSNGEEVESETESSSGEAESETLTVNLKDEEGNTIEGDEALLQLMQLINTTIEQKLAKLEYFTTEQSKVAVTLSNNIDTLIAMKLDTLTTKTA